MPAPPQDATPRSVRIVGYYFAPTVRNGFPVSSIKANNLTHISYAFANIDAQGRAVLGNPCFDIGECTGAESPHKQPGGNFAELVRLKKKHPDVRTLISIGGWSWSARFSDAASTMESRRRFAESAVKLFIRDHAGVFDGIDLDWEYPVSGGLPENKHRPEDGRNYTLLVQEFRRALDQAGHRADGKRYELTMTAPAGIEYARNFELRALARIVDFIKIMAFDYHSGGDIAHFNAPLAAAQGDPTPTSNVRATVEWYVKSGVASDKLILGVPFYGHGYSVADTARRGLFQRINQKASDNGAAPWVGAIRYHRIGEAMRSGFRRYWEPNAGVPWLYDPRRRIWITYDDVESLRLKSNLVREHKLGGMMIWELSGDDGTLLPAIHQQLRR